MALVVPAAYPSLMATLTPETPNWTDTAPVKISAVREMATTADRVFAALANHEAWPNWFDAIDRVDVLGEQREGIGARRSVYLARRRIRIDEEFIEWEPEKVWGFTVVEATGPFRLLVTLNERVTIQVIGPDRVRVTYLMALKPRGRSKLLFDKVLRRGLEKNLGSALDELGRSLS